ncbi:aminodeoxychorismate synthase component I [Brevundimonas sp.]|uniref:aminodeoxychorismate synthase component I n=1 Tax=Brevundimonas sp. TaxID=1871086 RepID=UPI002D48EBE4|nr:aminodeoxychorismate synthase component I [Brevundimonas sp.]HYC68074.1 aminodeoxychorismate synthase component I [Brevundimonas sp.]
MSGRLQPFQATESRVRPWRDPLAAAAGLRHRDGALALLSDGGPLGRWSFVAAEPDWTGGEGGLDQLRDPALSRGVVGLYAYDAGARPATGPRPPVWPDLMLARYPAMLAFDHAARTVTVAGRGPDAAAAATAADRAEAWLVQAADPGAPPPPAPEMRPEAAPEAYLAAVADVVARIAAGELFQANIARAWSGVLNPGADPFDIMLRLAGRAAAYGAFWRLGDRALVSNSPELFLTFDPAGGRIETRPIKGTRPRHPDPARDAALAAELQASAKDRAENLMIVDLMRNDLARVSAVGSVRVPELAGLESFASVHHLVSAVTARLRPGVGPVDLLRAAFPGGSVTGAPKVRAMEIIDEMEESRRGAYCGSVVWIGFDGAMDSSIVIRTLSLTPDAVVAQAGGGIVADSDPAAEWEEMLVKIRPLLAVLGGYGE